MQNSGNKFWGLMSKTIVGLVMAMMCCVGDVMATVQTGKTNTTATVNFASFACSDANYRTYVSQGYTSVYASKTTTDNTYTGDKAWFLENYCNGTSVVSGTERCFLVTASGAGIPSATTKKYLIYAADCNSGSTRNAIYISNSGSPVFGEDNKNPADSTLYSSSIAYVSFLVQCKSPILPAGAWKSSDAAVGAVQFSTKKYTKVFCNNYSVSDVTYYGCGSGYYGQSSGTSTGVVRCTACHGGTAGVLGKSTDPIGTTIVRSFNTSLSACSFACADYYYGVPMDLDMPCTRCPSASGYTLTGPTNNPYNTGTDISVCKYECARGYYGTANELSSTATTPSGCTACVSNATCAGGNGSTFSCDEGYYKCNKGTGAGSCRCGAFSMSGGCISYREECNKCPSATYNSSQTDMSGTGNYTVDGFTDGAGATAITQCKDDSGDGFYLQKDESGFWQYGTACPYSE